MGEIFKGEQQNCVSKLSNLIRIIAMDENTGWKLPFLQSRKHTHSPLPVPPRGLVMIFITTPSLWTIVYNSLSCNPGQSAESANTIHLLMVCDKIYNPHTHPYIMTNYYYQTISFPLFYLPSSLSTPLLHIL